MDQQEAYSNYWNSIMLQTQQQRIENLFQTKQAADIEFLVGNEATGKELIKAHTFVLGFGTLISPIFEAQFRWPRDKPIEVIDVSPSAFKAMLRYLYLGDLVEINNGNVADVLQAARKYMLQDLLNKCYQLATTTMLDVHNVLLLKSMAKFNGEQALEDFYWQFIDAKIDEFLETDEFLEMNQTEIGELLARDSIDSDEMTLFLALDRWAHKQCLDQNIEHPNGRQKRAAMGPALNAIRLPLMGLAKFTEQIAPTDIFDAEVISAIGQQISNEPAQHGNERHYSNYSPRNCKWDEEGGGRRLHLTISEDGCVLTLSAPSLEQLFFDRINNPNFYSTLYMLHNAIITDINLRNEIGVTPLTYAVPYGNLQLLGLFLANGANLEARRNKSPQHGWTPLHFACGVNEPNENVIRLLLEWGAQVNSRIVQELTPLHLLVHKRNSLRCVELLIRFGADVNAACRWRTGLAYAEPSFLPIHMAAQAGNVDILEALLRAGADLRALDGDGCTLLHYAAKGRDNNRDMATMRYLLDNGFDVNATSNDLFTPLHLAIAFNWPEGVEMLVAGGADCNARGNWVEHVTKYWQILVKELQNGMSPLHLAAIVGEEKIVEILLANGAKLEARTEMGYTPLYYAIKEKKPKVYLRLLDAGADPLQIGLESHIALLHYCLLGNDEKEPKNEEKSPKIALNMFEAILRLLILINYKANFDLPDANGWTLVHYAIRESALTMPEYKFKYLEILKKLLQNGASVNGTKKAPITPLQLAIENNFAEAVDLLFTFGGKPGQKELE